MQGTPVVQQTNKSVKVSRGYSGRPRPLLSDKDTPPIKDMYREGKLIQGITEQDMINEGLRAPLAYKCAKGVTKDGRLREIGRFEKSKQEREELKATNTRGKGPTGTGGSRGTRLREIKATLIIHCANLHHKKDFSTTISLQAYPSEVPFLIGNYHDPKKHKLVTKYYYRGETLYVA